MLSVNLNSTYSKILTIQIDFCSLKLCFSPLMWTQAGCIGKQVLVDVNWLNKTIYKSLLRKTINMLYCARCHFKNVGTSIWTSKIFFNFWLIQKALDSSLFWSHFHFYVSSCQILVAWKKPMQMWKRLKQF